jgi:hypothetical protein
MDFLSKPLYSLWSRAICANGTFPVARAYYPTENAMKTYFTNLPTKTWLLVILPVVVAAYPIVRIVVPAVVHAFVPEVVRSVLSVI